MSGPAANLIPPLTELRQRLDANLSEQRVLRGLIKVAEREERREIQRRPHVQHAGRRLEALV